MTTREEIAAELAKRKAEAEFRSLPQADRRVALGADPGTGYEVPPSGPQTERGETGEPITPPVPDNYGTVGAWSGVPITGDKNLPRKAMSAASGGATEAVGNAVAGAPAQAAAENQSTKLGGGVPQDEWAKLQADAYPDRQVAAAGAGPSMATENSASQANTDATAGKDPKAVATTLGLSDSADANAIAGMAGQQKAERSQYEKLQQVQDNEFRATQEFKKEADSLQDNYDKERQVQLARLQGIQKAMDAVPNAPRTIREKLAVSGTEDKIRFGLAAMFSIVGGGMMKDGGASAQNFLKTVQGNIDRGVQKEADEFARYGERAKMSNNIYAHLRENMTDDRDAMNVTKALYYDAAMHTVEQIATQYKMDMQSPQVQQLLEHLKRERAKLVLDTANNFQKQTVSQIGSKQVPVPAAKSFDKDFEEVVGKFGEEVEKRGGNVGERAISLYTQAMSEMRKAGFDKDEKFWRMFATFSSQSPEKQAFLLATMPQNQQRIIQLLVKAGNEEVLGEAGKQVTANELMRQVVAHGGYSISSIENVIKLAQDKRDQVANAVAGTYGLAGNKAGKAYWARKRMAELEGEHRGIAASPRTPIDVSDVRNAPR